MAKLHGKAKAAFLARMAKGRAKHPGKKRKSRRVSAHAAHLVKASVDRAAKEMKRMADECKAEIRQVKAAAKAISRGVKKKRKHPKKKHPKHAKPHHGAHRKPRHAKPHKPHKAHKHPKRRAAHPGDFAHAFGARPILPRHKRPVRRGDFARAFGHKAVKHVTAKQLLGRAGMKTWVCEAPVRTGCGGGAKGGHVLGDLSKNVALRLRGR